MNFFILVTGYNCAPLVRPCYDSIINQQGLHTATAVFISDGSTDGTDKEVLKLEGCYKVIGQNNKGAAYRRFKAIKELCTDEEAVIILLGMDDELRPGALHRIRKEYDKGMLMTYGNWKSDTIKFPKESLYFTEQTHADRSYRKEKYRSIHICTFKRFLFDQLTEDDFKVNGEWIKATTESPLMFACLEMCGKERIGVIEEAIYFYRTRKDNARKRLGDSYQNGIYKEIISRPKFDLI